MRSTDVISFSRSAVCCRQYWMAPVSCRTYVRANPSSPGSTYATKMPLETAACDKSTRHREGHQMRIVATQTHPLWKTKNAASFLTILYTAGRNKNSITTHILQLSCLKHSKAVHQCTTGLPEYKHMQHKR